MRPISIKISDAYIWENEVSYSLHRFKGGSGISCVLYVCVTQKEIAERITEISRAVLQNHRDQDENEVRVYQDMRYLFQLQDDF